MMNTKIKVSFRLNDKGQPADCEPHNRTEANCLVEEVSHRPCTLLTYQFMLLTNTSVAKAIAFGLPEQSLLRRHEAPIERRIVGRVTRRRKVRANQSVGELC